MVVLNYFTNIKSDWDFLGDTTQKAWSAPSPQGLFSKYTFYLLQPKSYFFIFLFPKMLTFLNVLQCSDAEFCSDDDDDDGEGCADVAPESSKS